MNLDFIRKLNWEIILKILGFGLAATSAYFQLRKVRPAARSQLKLDLEILGLLPEADPSHAVIKAWIDRRVSRLYGGAPPGKRKSNSNGRTFFWALFS